MDLTYPELNISHLRRLTDSTGIIQHAVHALPSYMTGYTTDDNARALIAALQIYRHNQDQACLEMAHVYLSFLHYVQTPDGKWHNFVAYNRCFLDEEGSEDSFGRTIWALGHTVASLPEHYLGRAAREMLTRALPWVGSLNYPRAMAFSLLGLGCYYMTFPSEQLLSLIHALAGWFVTALKQEAGPGWCWFEPRLTYSNAILPAGLFMAYRVTEHKPYLQAGRQTLDFLGELHLQNGYLKLVGNKGWYLKGHQPARFDEQPEDAGCLVLAATLACSTGRRYDYLRLAEKSFAWFLGQNELGIPLYDDESGGCYDGLTPAGVNHNRGAESLLAYLLSRLAVASVEPSRTTKGSGRPQVLQ